MTVTSLPLRLRRESAPDRVAVATRPLLGRSPALDGLRGLALIFVVTYHFTSSTGPFPGGWVGLDIFFVLSGFLITAILLDERRVYGRVSLPLFYARRACRLLPALFVMLAVWVALLLVFHDTTWFAATPGGDGTGDPVDISAALGQVGVTLAYGANWIYALGSGSAPLAHLWSLAVEEQFYLVWPVLLLLVLRLPAARRLWPVLALASVSALLPLLYWDGGAGTDRIYFGTDTRAVGMLLGAVAALVWHRRRAAQSDTATTGSALRARFSDARLAPWRAGLGLAAISVFLLTVGNIPLKSLGGPALMALAAMQVIPFVVDRPDSFAARAFQRPAMVWLGSRSYAIYLWHYLWATWLNPLSPWVSIPVGVSASLACAWLSWRYVEAPALRYGKRFRPVTPRPERQEPRVAPDQDRILVAA